MARKNFLLTNVLNNTHNNKEDNPALNDCVEASFFRAQISKTGFLRLPAVLRIIPVSKSTWWAGVKSGRFPKPYRLGGEKTRAVAWRIADIYALESTIENGCANAA